MNTRSMSEFRVIVEVVKENGYRVEYTNGCHWKFIPPDRTKQILYVSSTPNRPRNFIQRIKRDLRSRGLSI